MMFQKIFLVCIDQNFGLLSQLEIIAVTVPDSVNNFGILRSSLVADEIYPSA